VGIVLVMRGIWVVARSALVTGADEWVAGRGTP